jgi:hypothetical protein
MVQQVSFEVMLIYFHKGLPVAQYVQESFISFYIYYRWDYQLSNLIQQMCDKMHIILT